MCTGRSRTLRDTSYNESVDYEASRSKHLLIFGGGVLIFILVAGGWFLLQQKNQQSPPMGAGTLFFSSAQPTPGIYAYAVASGKTLPFLVPSAGDTLQSASFSPNGAHLVDVVATPSAVTISVQNTLGNTMSRTIASTKKGSEVGSPIISDDGTAIAYLVSVAPSPHMTSSSKLATSTLNLAVATFAQGSTTLRYFATNVAPVAFYPDHTQLLVRAGAVLGILTTADPQNIVPFKVNLAATSSVALSPYDQATFAATL